MGQTVYARRRHGVLGTAFLDEREGETRERAKKGERE